MTKKRSSRRFGKRNPQTRQANRRLCFESLESRELLAITLPTIVDQTVLAGAPLNIVIAPASTTSNPIDYTIAIGNSHLTNAQVTNPQLTASVSQNNPSLSITVSANGGQVTGTMVFQLFQDLAPDTVNKIVTLANQGFYNGLSFHRIIEDFMVQGGDPTGTGTGGPGFEFDDEFNSLLQFTSPGLLAMANSGADTNGSQFFITNGATRWLDFRHTIFGIITEGSNVLQALDSVPTDANDKPLQDAVMTQVTTFYDTQDNVLRLSVPNGTTGSADITITATDRVTHETATTTFHTLVQQDTVDDRPFLGDISPITMPVNGQVTFNIPATDVEGDPIYYAGSVDAANSMLTLNINSATGAATLSQSGGQPGVYSILLGVRMPSPPTDNTATPWDIQAVAVYVNPAAPTGITLLAQSDTGSSSSDLLTNLNNSAGKTLQFSVGGVLVGANVELFADGVLLGSAVATGTSVVITTNSTVTLSDGSHAITAKQTLQNQQVDVGNLKTSVNLASTASAALNVTVAATPPQFNFTPEILATEGTAYACQVVTQGGAPGAMAFALISPPSGMSIGASSGLIAWTPAVGASGAVSVFLRATDSAGNYADYDYTLNVMPINIAPELTAANPSLGSTTEDQAFTIALDGTFVNNGAGTTTITDADNAVYPGGIALVAFTGSGTWQFSLDGNTFSDIGTVSESAALLLSSAASLRYLPNNISGELPTITYRAWDEAVSGAGVKFNITVHGGSSAFSDAADTATLVVTDVNDAPVLVPAGASLGTTMPGEARTIHLLGELINAGPGSTAIADADPAAVIGGIALTAATGQGTWEYSFDGTTFTAVGAVDLSTALLLPGDAVLRYTPNGAGNETATITYVAWDTSTGSAADTVDLSDPDAAGATTAFSTASDTVSLLVNTAPTLAPASPDLGTITEDQVFTAQLSAAVFNNGAGTTTIADADQTTFSGGIAITGLTGAGMWAYSLDGTTFVAIATVSLNSALLLPGDATVRFTPDGANGGTAGFTYRAWDTSAGQAGQRADLSAIDAAGGSTAFSETADTASLTMTDLNDAPVVAPANPSIGSTPPTTTKTFALADLLINHGAGTTTITDVDTGAALGAIALTFAQGEGIWYYSLDGGATFQSVVEVSEMSALLLPADAILRYTPDSVTAETASIRYYAWDRTTGANGDRVNLTVPGATGGTTAFSVASDTATLTVLEPNTAPVLTPASPSLGNTLPTAAKTFLLSDSFINKGTGTTVITDADAGAVLGGIALTGVSGSGTWSYSLDGTTYTAVGTVSSTSALLLPKTASIRYTPDGTTAESPSLTYRAWDTTSRQAGDKVDASTNGDHSAFSATADTATLTVASGSISGYVYVDTNDDGLRTTTNGGMHLAIPGVVIRLYAQNAQGAWIEVSGKSPVTTDATGAYRFESLAPGLYRVAETQPGSFLDGKETLGTIQAVVTGTARQDQLDVQLGAGANAVNYNFGERGLVPSVILTRLFYASTPPAAELIAQIIAEESAASSAALSVSTLSLATTTSDSSSLVSSPAANAAAYSVTLSQPTYNSESLHQFSFTLADTELAAAYQYTVTSSGGGTISGSGEIVAPTQQVSDVDLDPLSDGTLAFSVELFDAQDTSLGQTTLTATLDRTITPPAADAADQALAEEEDWLTL